jgi:hypothetical protein
MNIVQIARSLVSTKKHKIITTAVILTILIGSSAAYAVVNKESPVVVQPVAVVQPKAPTTAPTPTPIPKVASITTGSPVDDATNQNTTIAAIIENSLEARPQSGLAQADIIFEAIAEGGITRFLAIYHDEKPEAIGPIRSARPYFVSWAHGFEAPLAHAGGSPVALDLIYELGSKDIDEFSNSTPFYRSTERYAPHNLYTSYNNLVQNAESRGLTKAATSPFATRQKPTTSPIAAAKISVGISGPQYNSTYTYNATTGSYDRFQYGANHSTADGKTISPNAVIAIETYYGIDDDGIHSVYQVNGDGAALLFQNGTVENITWSKDSASSDITFKTNDRLATITPGKTWIVALPDLARVTYE